MSWVRLDDAVADHPDVDRVGDAALGALLRLAGHAARHIEATDGTVPAAWARRNVPQDALDRLLGAGLLSPDGDGYKITTALVNLRSAAEVREERAAWAERQERHRLKVRAARIAAIQGEGQGDSHGVTHADSHPVSHDTPYPSRPDPIPDPEPKKRKKQIAARTARRRACESKFDLEGLYKTYPRKEGKSDGLAIAAKEIQTQEDFDQLRTAITNYSAQTATTERKYVKHFSTFMGCWRDFLEPAPPDGAFRDSGIDEWNKRIAEMDRKRLEQPPRDPRRGVLPLPEGR